MITGIEEEERRVIDEERPEYDDFCFWRASFQRGIRRHGFEEAFVRRKAAAKMRELIMEAAGKPDKKKIMP